MSVQKQNNEMKNLLTPGFQRRKEPNFAVGNALSTFLMLPNLRGLWPMSSKNEAGAYMDLSGQGRTLSNIGNVPTLYDGLVAAAGFDGATQYLSRADEAGLDVTGAMTVGGWFKFSALGTSMVCMSKFTGGGNQRSFLLQKGPANNPEFYVSGDGAALVGVGVGGVGITTSKYVFIVGRYTPAEIAVFGNDQKATQAAGVPASIFNSSAGLLIGGVSAAASLNGGAALCFLCGNALSDAMIRNLFNQTRAAFGV